MEQNPDIDHYILNLSERRVQQGKLFKLTTDFLAKNHPIEVRDETFRRFLEETKDVCLSGGEKLVAVGNGAAPTIRIVSLKQGCDIALLHCLRKVIHYPEAR